MDLGLIKKELATVLAVAGISAHSSVPDASDLPGFVIANPTEIRYNTTFASTSEIDITISIFVKGNASGQSLIDKLVSTDKNERPYHLLIDHLPINYRKLQVLNANNFHSEQRGDTRVFIADINLTIYS